MPHDKITVLLVDDHTVVRDGVRLMLGTARDIVVTGEADNALDALRMVREKTFDVALVDIALPDKNGLELLKQFRVEQPKLAVLILSMYSEEVYALRAIKYGAVGYLTKNCSATTVVAAVRKAAAGGRHVSPALAEKLANMLSGSNTALHEELSNREIEVLRFLAAGVSLLQIGESMHISTSTVATYRARILQKMSMKSNVELARYALESGLLL